MAREKSLTWGQTSSNSSRSLSMGLIIERNSLDSPLEDHPAILPGPSLHLRIFKRDLWKYSSLAFSPLAITILYGIPPAACDVKINHIYLDIQNTSNSKASTIHQAQSLSVNQCNQTKQ